MLFTRNDNVVYDVLSCFVCHSFSAPFALCSLTRYNFDENTKGGFVGHITREHNLLHVFFMQRLRKHEAEDYTGVESSVRSVMDNVSTLTDKVNGWHAG